MVSFESSWWAHFHGSAKTITDLVWYSSKKGCFFVGFLPKTIMTTMDDTRMIVSSCSRSPSLPPPPPPSSVTWDRSEWLLSWWWLSAVEEGWGEGGLKRALPPFRLCPDGRRRSDSWLDALWLMSPSRDCNLWKITEKILFSFFFCSFFLHTFPGLLHNVLWRAFVSFCRLFGPF